MTDKPRFGPLPAPPTVITDKGNSISFGYTASQLHAARLDGFRLGVQEAAKVCAEQRERSWKSASDAKLERHGELYGFAAETALYCERAIRALPEPDEQGETQ
jgi:hypothetical protein